MKYSEFEDIISQQRMRKYLLTCNNESKRAMTLYRYNLKLSQEMMAYMQIFAELFAYFRFYFYLCIVQSW